MYKKRGISPLITTVLLIGLVISLATIAIIWSRANIKTRIKGAEQSMFKLSCREIDFDILDACYTSINDYKAIKIRAENNKDEPINAGFIIKIINGETSLNPSSPVTELDAHEIKTFTVPFSISKDDIKKISIMPKIKSGKSNPVVCPNQALNLRMEEINPC